jgi:nucleoside-diphosphate-sugar epimerase
MLRKLLLTGSTGFVGNAFLNELRIDFEVITLGRGDCHINVDLGLEVPAFEDSFSLVIHSAGKAHFAPNSFVDDFYKVNVNGTANLLRGLENSFIPKRFVFISSVAVYGIQKGEFIVEESPLNANDSYGMSKIESEKLVEEWCCKNDVKLTILRLPLVVGNNPPGNLGDLIKSIKKGFYFNIGTDAAKKSMVLAEDVAKVIDIASEVGGIYNLTDGYHPSFSEFSSHISIQLGKGIPKEMPLSLAKIFAKVGDLCGNNAPFNTNKLYKITSSLTFDDSKARMAFGWNPTPVLEGFKII